MKKPAKVPAFLSFTYLLTTVRKGESHFDLKILECISCS